MIRRLSVVFYWAVLIALLGLFFTNDFGLMDIHKTSIIVAVGIDSEEGELQVTAQIAIPQPSQNGENIMYAEVQGSGPTVADALNEINAKTGFYPKLLFCKLILLGESCRDENIFMVLGNFYRSNYSEVTALVAMCEGKASDMLSLPARISPETSTAIQRVLSDELEKSANVSSVTLKDIAVAEYSESAACYMPYIQANKAGTSESGGGGDSIGGDEPDASSQGGSGGGSESGSGGSSAGPQGQSGSGEPVEFTARKTALFRNGEFQTVLDERQSFALDVLLNKIRVASMPCPVGEEQYTVELKKIKGDVGLKINRGEPELTLSFSARASVQGSRTVLDPDKSSDDDVVKAEVLRGAEEEIKSRFEELAAICAEKDCDVLGVRNLLYKSETKYYDAMGGDILSRLKVKYDIKIKSLN